GVAVVPAAITQIASSQNPAAGSYNVRAFGAKGDGKQLDTIAINKTIEAAAAAGGGTVYFPAGDYLSTSIRLKSNVALYLDQGATIIATETTATAKYDSPEPNEWDAYQDFGHSHWHNSLIWGENLENVSITGPGRIWGRGLVRLGSQSRTAEQNAALANLPGESRAGPYGFPSKRDAVEDGWGNKAIALKLSRNVTIRDITILHGGHFAILATGVDNLTIDNLKIDTNRDGIDVDSCKNVRISNTMVNSPLDDAICPKSSYALGYARATENVTITNCQVSGYVEGTLLDGTFKREPQRASGDFSSPMGRIKFGTESNGGFKNITISNCVFDYSRGIALESVDGALLEDVTITNITMREITNAPIFMRLGFRGRGPKDSTTVGALRRVIISNVVVYNAGTAISSIIAGIPGHPIEDVTLSNIRIYSKGGGTEAQAALEPVEKDDAYPEPTMFGDTPSCGFFIRNAKGLRIDQVSLSYMKDDLRPAFVLNNVTGVEFSRVSAQRANASTFVLKNVQDFGIHDSYPLPDKRIESAKAEKF
ncbi:MAG TPA: glycosyl hydrolase family 28-related protein, partial [Pyrinomonadaceae bacterium]|nr:glycosyl hydrolase family 28-related protein [Pyrinomonadaceae bacterium]